VPDNKIKWDEGNPTGHGIIFIGVKDRFIATFSPAACDQWFQSLSRG
jgi:hypothetical protein